MFDEIRGYGFVTPEAGGEDAFVHVNDLEFDKNLIAPGTQVEFTMEHSDRGFKASHVRLLDNTAPPTPVAQARPEHTAGPDRDPQDDLCDVLTEAQLTAEMTERLLAGVPTLTGQQIVAVRALAVTVARQHGWIDD